MCPGDLCDQSIRIRPPDEKDRATKDPKAAMPCPCTFAAADALPLFPLQFHGRGHRNCVLCLCLELSIRGIPPARLLRIEVATRPGRTWSLTRGSCVTH